MQNQMSIQTEPCLLFVPGSRPERFTKAVASNADMVCIDLEDAVLLDEKSSARKSVIEFLHQHNGKINNVGVRINCLTQLDGLKDIIALSEAKVKPNFIMLPKVSDAKEIQILNAYFEDVDGKSISLIALVETPEGIRNSASIARSCPNLKAIMLGGADLSVELGCQMDWDGLAYSRGQLISAAAEVNLAVIDVPFLDIHDNEGLIKETQRIRNLGFTAKSAIHPCQVEPIQQSFMPSDSEIEKARLIIDAVTESDQGAIQVNGQLVDRPVILAAQKTLKLAQNKKP